MLWSYRTSFRATTGETPFSLAYEVEAVIPVEISLPTFCVDNFDEENNDVLLALATDLLEEKREISQVRLLPFGKPYLGTTTAKSSSDALPRGT